MNASLPDSLQNRGAIVHLVRHGRIPDHRADNPLTAEGCQETLEIGRRLAAQVRPGETIGLFASPTRRTRQTAEMLRQGLLEGLSRLGLEATVAPVLVEDRLQNLQLYLNGLGYDPVRPLFDAARWLLQENPSPQFEASVAFQAGFWQSPDPMDYWLTHPSPAFEAPESVAERIRAYLAERLSAGPGGNSPRRDICVSHSANLRAFLQLALGRDPGEPDFGEMLTVSGGVVRFREQAGDFPFRGEAR